MTPEDQEARSLKWEPRDSVMLRKLSTGRWAMYPCGGVGSPFWIGSLSDIEEAYARRPAPERHARPTKPVAGIDLSKVRITL